MKIFPHVLTRIGGVSFPQIETDKLSLFIIKLQDQKEKQKELANEICDSIYELMPSLQNSDTQKQLLNIKRDVFNIKAVTISKIETLDKDLPDNLFLKLKEYATLTATIIEQIKQGESFYKNEIDTIRRQLAGLINKDKFKQGLILSSGSLLGNIPNYLNTPSTNFRKKEFQVETGLIKYITRMYAKTSPYSTFTNLAIGRIGNEEEKDEELLEEIPYQSHIRINNRLYEYLKLFLESDPAVYSKLKICCNPTLTKNEKEEYIYLASFRNQEAFQSAPVSEIVTFFIEFANSKDGGYTYKEFIETIIQNEYIDASEEEIKGFIKQLLGFGIFDLDFGVSGTDPDWDIKLVNLLLPVVNDSQPIKQLVEALQQTRTLSIEYAQGSSFERKKILIQVYTIIRDACWNMHKAVGLPEEERISPEEYYKKQRENYEQKQKERIELAKQKAAEAEKEGFEKAEETLKEAPKDFTSVFERTQSTFFYFTPEQIFYEETSLSVSPLFNNDQLTDFTTKLNSFLQAIPPIYGTQDERDRMLYYFENKYGAEASVDLFTFYHDYFKEYKKPEAELKQQKEIQKKNAEANKDAETKSPINELEELNGKIGVIQQRSINMSKWMEALSHGIAETIDKTNLPDEVTITLDQLIKAGENLSIVDSTTPKHSYGAFVQFYKENNQLKGVVNSTFMGYGKLMSRFLHLFDDKITAAVRAWNLEQMGNTIFMENCDSSYHGANIHPPLMPYEVWIPSSHNTLPKEHQIPITALTISINKEENQLQLIHEKTKKRAYVFDLGFQAEMGRSALFRVLKVFKNGEEKRPQQVSPNVVTSSVNKNYGLAPNEPKRIITLPRIVYEKNIILQRKTWFIYKELLVIRGAQESEWEYYLRVNEWRKKNNIPNDVFVFIMDRGADVKADDKGKKAQRDDYKPQYISFSNPLLVDMFGKMCTRVPLHLKIEEMSPAPKELSSFHKKPYVSEAVLQWYT